MDKIMVRGLEISARHGVYDFEKREKQRFVFDADIYYDLSAAAFSDDVAQTISYADVCALISQITACNTFNLIETLAYRCAYAVLDGFPASRIALMVYKPDAPVKEKFASVGVSVDVRRERVLLSLGSNMGDRRAYLGTAIEKLGNTAGIKVKKVSSYIATPPYGGAADGEFLNCAAEVETYLTPHGLLKEINRIEAECGRVRGVRWGNRTLDIDIIFYGKQIVCDDDLQIPHADYLNRGFVLTPLKEIAPEFVCPDTGKKIKDI